MGFFGLFDKKPKSLKNPYADEYFKELDQIETMWSVIQNLKLFHGKEASALERLCIKNIDAYLKMCAYDRKIKLTPPIYAPCYHRLAMLYEKQEEWKKAIEICVEAIRNGATDDHSKGKMYGRLARMIRKAGIKLTGEMTKYISLKG